MPPRTSHRAPRRELLALPGGRTLEVRSMRPGDAAGIMALYQGLADEDRYRRFFSCFRPTEAFVQRWIEDCRAKGVGLVAVEHGGRHAPLVAEAGYVTVANGNGELAMTIARAHRGWLGPYLLDRLVEEARARGIDGLEADVLVENRPMLALMRRRGSVTTADSDVHSVHVRIGTDGEGPTWPRGSGGTRRLVVEARSMWWRPAEALRKAGLDVVTCTVGGEGRPRCPMAEGRPCPLVTEADAVLVAVPPELEDAHRLIAAHEQYHPHVDVLVDTCSPEAALAAASPGETGDVAAAVCAAVPSVVVVRRGVS